MDETKQLKLMYWFVIAFTVIVVVPIAVYAGYVIVLRISEQYPEIGVIGWSAIAVWFLSNPLLFLYINKKCNRRNYQANCSRKAMLIMSLYAGVSLTIYVLIAEVL